MNWIKCFFGFHDYKRYDDRLVEQLFVGGYYGWKQCQRCLQVRFLPVEDTEKFEKPVPFRARINEKVN